MTKTLTTLYHLSALLLVLAIGCPAQGLEPALREPVRDTVDVLERNYFYDDGGRLVFCQLIGWHWYGDVGEHHVSFWRLCKGPEYVPQYDRQRRDWFVLFRDGDTFREVRSRSYLETWTQTSGEGDREANDRPRLPATERQELGKPIKKTTPLLSQQGLTTFPEKEEAMAERIVNGVRYRSIPGFSRYEAGDDGSVWSWIAPGSHGVAHEPHPVKQAKDKKGYCRVSLANDAGEIKGVSVHRAVLFAFAGAPPAGQEACHNNGNPSDNRPANLRWDSRKANHADKWLHGTQQAGSQHPHAILDEDRVLAIKQRLTLGHTLKAIASDHGVDRTTVSKIRTGEHWPHVAPELHAKFPPSYRSRRFGVDISALAREAGISSSLVFLRLKKGLSLDEALAPQQINRLPKNHPRRLAAEAVA